MRKVQLNAELSVSVEDYEKLRECAKKRGVTTRDLLQEAFKREVEMYLKSK